jgi:glycosyltransferase involved in cell wall biosynthesis
MTARNTVTVVVPCFNTKKYVDEALLSIRNQTYTELDIIAVNDGSTDETPQLLDRHAECDPRVRVVHQPNRGLPGARNAGLRQARGEFVCFLDADDVMVPDKIEKQVQFLRDNPGIDLVYSDYFVGDGALGLIGLVAARLPEGNVLDAFSHKNWLAVMTPLVRRSLIENVGEFDETLRASEDWDYWIRCATAGTFGYLPGPLAIYRMYPTQMHNDGRRMFTAEKQVVNKHFRSDSGHYRPALAAFYERHAKYAWTAQRHLKAGLYLALSVYYSRTGSVTRVMGRSRVGGSNRLEGILP